MKIQSWTDPRTCRTLNLDLSLRNIGWAIVNCGTLESWGCIENPVPAGKGQERAVNEIQGFSPTFDKLRALAAECQLVNCEIIYTSQSLKGAIAMGYCWATVSFLRTFRPTNIIFPRQVKQIVKPKGEVTKDEVAKYVKGMHAEIAFKQLVDHITDAVAVYHAYLAEYIENDNPLFKTP